jgi:hypothetical protein
MRKNNRSHSEIGVTDRETDCLKTIALDDNKNSVYSVVKKRVRSLENNTQKA